MHGTLPSTSAFDAVVTRRSLSEAQKSVALPSLNAVKYSR